MSGGRDDPLPDRGREGARASVRGRRALLVTQVALASLILAAASRAALRRLVSDIGASIDLITALVVVVTVAAIALLASTLPARRATAIDRMVTLR